MNDLESVGKGGMSCRPNHLYAGSDEKAPEWRAGVSVPGTESWTVPWPRKLGVCVGSDDSLKSTPSC